MSVSHPAQGDGTVTCQFYLDGKRTTASMPGSLLDTVNAVASMNGLTRSQYLRDLILADFKAKGIAWEADRFLPVRRTA